MENQLNMFGELPKQVKPRFDKGGSEFGLIHRKLPLNCGMFDVDRMSATATLNLELKQQNICFFEYRVDFKNSSIKWEALFEIKYKDCDSVRDALRCNIGTATWAQLKLCNLIGARYFFVIANNGIQPFIFYEINFIGGNEILGTLDYKDRDSDGIIAINNFWKYILHLI